MSSNMRFYDILEMGINKSVQPFLNQPLTPETMKAIRTAITDSVSATFSASTHNISREAVVWTSDQYFKSISIESTGQLMSDNVVINEYNLSELSLFDIVTLSKIFAKTKLEAPLNDELTRRSKGKS